jgi:hypothetical protein
MVDRTRSVIIQSYDTPAKRGLTPKIIRLESRRARIAMGSRSRSFRGHLPLDQRPLLRGPQDDIVRRSLSATACAGPGMSRRISQGRAGQARNARQREKVAGPDGVSGNPASGNGGPAAKPHPSTARRPRLFGQWMTLDQAALEKGVLADIHSCHHASETAQPRFGQ